VKTRLGLLLIAALIAASAQQASLTINDAVQQSVAKYPAVRGSLEQVAAAAAGITWLVLVICRERIFWGR
jgi:hypothetical protein